MADRDPETMAENGDFSHEHFLSLEWKTAASLQLLLH